MRFYSSVCSVFVLVCLLSASCGKKQPEASAESSDVAVAEIPEPVPEETLVEGKILAKKAVLCLFGRDFSMHPVVSLAQGASVSVLALDGEIERKIVPEDGAAVGSEQAENGTDTESEAAAFSSGTEYVHAVHDNMDFWLEASVFALNCENAVAIERTALYRDPALSESVPGKHAVLPFAALVAKAKDEPASENSPSTKIFYYDEAEKSVREAFAASSAISTKNDDIVVSRIAEELKTTKRAGARNELFAKAAAYKPSGAVLSALNAQKTETTTYNYQEVLKAVSGISRGVYVDELLTVDQSSDPFK